MSHALFTRLIYVSSYDYEEVASEGANKMITLLRSSIGDAMNGKELMGYKVIKSDDFEYTDPIDKSVSSKQVRGLCRIYF